MQLPMLREVMNEFFNSSLYCVVCWRQARTQKFSEGGGQDFSNQYVTASITLVKSSEGVAISSRQTGSESFVVKSTGALIVS